MGNVIDTIERLGLVPVIKLEDAKDAVPLARALLDAGLPVAEITFRTDAAEASIKAIAGELPDVLVGAGTVLSVDQAKRARAAGARFIVTPGFNPRVVDYCVENDIPITPGINNPTGVEMALERGLSVVKFFPAEASGGTVMLKAMSGPYVGVRYIPTGGISPDNVARYLSMKQVLACGGSWMVPSGLIAEGKFDEIRRLVKEAVALVEHARGK